MILMSQVKYGIYKSNRTEISQYKEYTDIKKEAGKYANFLLF